jgi:hypothetical protein
MIVYKYLKAKELRNQHNLWVADRPEAVLKSLPTRTVAVVSETWPSLDFAANHLGR